MSSSNLQPRATAEVSPPFQKIQEAARTTGLSQCFLRDGCRRGTVPHVKSGTAYYVNIPALLRKLDEGGMDDV